MAKRKNNSKKNALSNGKPHRRRPKLQKVLIRDLHAHPLQAEIFGDSSEQDFAELKQSIQAHGIAIPPEVLPDGVIVKGHRRIRAARELGWKLVDVIVRRDLEGADEATIRALIEDNLERRQLSLLQKARAIVRLAEIEAEQLGHCGDWESVPSLREAVLKRLGGSARNANRYVKLVQRSPLAVQNAVDAGYLFLGWAERLGALDAERRGTLATAIEQLQAQPNLGASKLRQKIRALAKAELDAQPRLERLRPKSRLPVLDRLRKRLEVGLAEVVAVKARILAELKNWNSHSWQILAGASSSKCPDAVELVRGLKSSSGELAELVVELASAVERPEDAQS